MSKSHSLAAGFLLRAALSLLPFATAAQAANTLALTSTLVDPQAGTDSVLLSVPANMQWSAIANDSWLHTTAAGSNSAAVVYTYDANSGATRTGTLTIAGQTFTVTQPGASYQRTNSFGSVASPGIQFYASLTTDGAGNVYLADQGRNSVYKYNPATQALDLLFSFSDPMKIRADAAGNLYLMSPSVSKVVKWTAATQTFSDVITSAQNVVGLGDIAVDPSGNIYVIGAQKGTFDFKVFKYTAATQTDQHHCQRIGLHLCLGARGGFPGRCLYRGLRRRE